MKNRNLVGDSGIFVLRGSGIEGVGRYQNFGEKCELGGRVANEVASDYWPIPH